MTATLPNLVTLLRPLHKKIERDVRARLNDDAAVAEAKRFLAHLAPDVTFDPDNYAHNAATVIVLKAAFLKAMEDQGLMRRPKISERDLHFGDQFQAMAPYLSWSDYLRYAFREAAYHPLAYDLFRETAYEAVYPSDDLVKELIETVATLSFAEVDSRILGDLYENLMDQKERKRLGYYTTPDFIIDFILDRTLDPALKEKGGDLRYLEPACGTGHFLVRAYRRIRDHLLSLDPTQSRLQIFKQVVENNLVGVDISEFAVRITLFRFLLEALQEAKEDGIPPEKLSDHLKDVAFNVFVANTLVRSSGEERARQPLFEESVEVGRELDPLSALYGRSTHLKIDLQDAFKKKFHVVNANPPYVRVHGILERIIVRGPNGETREEGLVEYLRREYESAYKQFDLSLPFLERALELTVRGGYVGFITTGKFAKQDYGKKLVGWLKDNAFYELVGDLTDGKVFEGVGVYPTLLILRRRIEKGKADPKRQVEVLVTYQPVKSGSGEPLGGAEAFEYYKKLLHKLETEGEDVFTKFAGAYFENAKHFWEHPWTYRRGNNNILDKVKNASSKVLEEVVSSIGEDYQSNADPVFVNFITQSFIRRWGFEKELVVPTLRGENVRNWGVKWRGNRKKKETFALYTLDSSGKPVELKTYPVTYEFLHQYRHLLANRKLGWAGTVEQEGLPWWIIGRRNARLGVPKIIWAEIAPHGEFILDVKGEFLARHSCQVAYVDDLEKALALLSYLRSTITAYFVKSHSARFSASTASKSGFRWRADILRALPVHTDILKSKSLIDFSKRWLEIYEQLRKYDPYVLIRKEQYSSTEEVSALFNNYIESLVRLTSELADIQNQIDYEVYRIYALSDNEIEELETPLYKRPWPSKEDIEKEFAKDFAFQAVDYTADLIEDIFRAQPPKGAKLLSAEDIFLELTSNESTTNRLAALGTVASGHRFTDFAAVRYLINEALKSDHRPIPYDPAEHLVGRGDKKVDIFHERFLLFPADTYTQLEENLYGWSGWSPEAQVNAVLELALQHQRDLDPQDWRNIQTFVNTHLSPRLDERTNAELKALFERMVG